jgi:hypothetical protein
MKGNVPYIKPCWCWRKSEASGSQLRPSSFAAQTPGRPRADAEARSFRPSGLVATLRRDGTFTRHKNYLHAQGSIGVAVIPLVGRGVACC